MTSRITRTKYSDDLEVDISGEFEGRFVGDMGNGQEGMTMMLPLSDDNMRYNINTKIPGFKVKEGKLSKGGKLIFECTE